MNDNSQSGSALPKPRAQTGLVKLIILIVVAIIILSYLGINIQKIAESDAGRANFGYVWQIILKIWDWLAGLYQPYLAGPINQVWKTIAPFLGNKVISSFN